jgi:hypothetical protein
MPYNSYNIYLDTKGATATNGSDYYKDYTQAILDDDFANAPNYRMVDKYDRSNVNGIPDETLGVRLSKPFDVGRVDSKISDDFTMITFGSLDYKVYAGDIFEFAEHRWMVVESESKGSIYKKCLVEKCNVELRFVEEPYINTSQGIFYGSTPVSESMVRKVWGISNVRLVNPVEEQFNNSSNSSMNIRVPYNSLTRTFREDVKKGTRFLFGNPSRAWQIADIDNITYVNEDINGNLTDGYLNIRLDRTEKHPRDNDSLNIAWQLWW